VTVGEKTKIALPVIGLCVLIDQLTKVWATSTLPMDAPWRYLGDVLRLQYAKNTGAFLSLGAGLSDGARFWIFVVGVGGLIVAMSIYLFRSSSLMRIEVWAFSLAIAGGIGNLIDRLTFGFVRDFMNVGIGPVRTGIFNVADMAISAAACLLVWFLLSSKSAPAA